MEQHFGNSIERGLFHIERQKKLLSTEMEKQKREIESDDCPTAPSDLFTVEGCCYELALYLLKKREAAK